MQPDCSICGKPSPLGDICKACQALKMRGYDLTTDEVSGAKSFTAISTAHFYEGYKAAQREILKEQMAAV